MHTCLSTIRDLIEQEPQKVSYEILEKVERLEKHLKVHTTAHVSKMTFLQERIRELENELKSCIPRKKYKTLLYAHQGLQAAITQASSSLQNPSKIHSVSPIQRDKLSHTLRVQHTGTGRKGRPDTILVVGEAAAKSERYGALCVQLVADCCFALGLEEVHDLVPAVQTSKEILRTVPHYHEFFHDIEHMLTFVNVREFFYLAILVLKVFLNLGKRTI